jgi:tetratricopeptide (TPR) repeat protein
VIPYRFFIVLLAVITCSGCAPGLTVPDIKPARVGWESIHNVALLRFDGPYGETIRGQIYHRLDEVQHFNPLDPAGHPALDEVTYDMIEGAEFLHITEGLEADLVIGGRVAGAINDTHGLDQVQVKEGTGYYKKEKNLYGQWVDVEIKRTVVRSLPYVIRQASLTTDYRVFEMNTGGIIATGKVTENCNKKLGGDKADAHLEREPGNAPPPAACIDELSFGIAAKLVAKLSRMKVSSMVKFDNSAHAMVRRGVALAKDGAWEDAIHLWQEVIGSDPTNPAAHYNLGVAYEGLGDLENLGAAMSFYEKAARYGDKELYADGIARVKRIIQQSDNN